MYRRYGKMLLEDHLILYDSEIVNVPRYLAS
jgi:hypothetical protein